MKRKLLLMIVALLCSVVSWAQASYTLSFDLTGRSADDWSNIVHVNGQREYAVSVNGTGGYLLVYGWKTTASGLQGDWNNCDLAVRYLTNGAVVKFTLSDAGQASNLTLHTQAGATRTVSGNVVTVSISSADVNMIEMRATTGTFVIITKLEITLPIPATYNYNLKDLGSKAWKSISPLVYGNTRNYEVTVNKTEENLMVWGWDTGSAGVSASGEWLAVRNLSQGDQVALTFASGSNPSNVTLNPSEDDSQLTSSISGQVLTTNIVSNRRMFELTPTASTTIEKLSITRNRIDMTGFIKNPRFVDSDVTNHTLSSLSGWTLTRDGGNGNLKSTIAEFWNCTFDVNQPISNLPNGKYVVSVKATSKDAKGVLYASSNGNEYTTALMKTSNNDNFGAIVTELNKSHGDAHRKSVVAYVTNNELTVGVKQTESHNGDTWIVMGEFSLAYEGPTLATDATELTGSMEAGKWYYFTAGANDKWIDAPTPSDIVFETDGNKLTSTPGSTLSEMTMTSGTKYYIKSSSAQTVAVSEQTIASGTYYLYSPYTGLFLGSGANYGTAAFVDKYGVPFNLELHADGYMLKFVDWDKYLYSDAWLFVDGANGAKFKITESTVGDYTGYAFYNKAATSNNRLYVYLKDNGDKYRVAGNAIIGDNCDEVEQTVWQFKSVEEHNTIVNAYPTDNINHVITAANIGDKTNAAGFETYLSTYYDANDMTDKIGTSTFGDDAGSWTWTLVENRKGSDGYRYGTAWQYQRTGAYTQTIDDANLPAGIYKVEMGGFDRHASESLDISFASNYGSLSSSYLKANGEQVRMKAWADVEGRPTTGETQANSINSGAADNVVYVYLDGSTDLNLKVCKPAYLAECYFNFGNFRLTRYTLKVADVADYTALNTAIAAAEAHTLGFESGEYAPYNNVERLSELANAKAINQEADNTKEMVDASTNALNDGAWTANVGEVNAIYNGDFALSENNGAMAGWVTDHSAGLGGALHARAFVLNSGDGNYDYLAAFGQGDGTRSCAYFRFDGTNSAKTTKYTYGSTTGYTMPLKTGTIYKLTAQAGGWGQVGKAFKMDVVNSSDASLVAQALTTPATGVHAGGPVIDYEMYFVVPANGNYKLVLNNTSGADNAVAVSNIELFSTDALILAENTTYAAGTYPSVTLDRTFANTSNWYTLCAPFDFPKSAFAEVKVLDHVTDKTADVNMTFTDASETIAAGTPCLVKPASADATLSVEDVAIDPATSAGSTVESDGTTTVTYVGTFEDTSIDGTTVTNAWVVSNNALYHVAEGHNATVGAYRAYFTVATGGTVKALSYDFGDAVGIEAIDNGQLTIDNDKVIYNLAGQKMNKLQRGVNIVNGKKVLVK